MSWRSATNASSSVGSVADMIDLLRPQVMGAAVGALVMGFLSGLGLGTVVAGSPAPAARTSVSSTTAAPASPTTKPDEAPTSQVATRTSTTPCDRGPTWRPLLEPKFVLGLEDLRPSELAGVLRVHVENVPVDDVQNGEPAVGAKAFEDRIRAVAAKRGDGVVLMRAGDRQRNGAKAAARDLPNTRYVVLRTDEPAKSGFDASAYPPSTLVLYIGPGTSVLSRTELDDAAGIITNRVSCEAPSRKGSSTI